MVERLIIKAKLKKKSEKGEEIILEEKGIEGLKRINEFLK